MSLAAKSNSSCVLFQAGLPNVHPTAAEVSDWVMVPTGYSLNGCDLASWLPAATELPTPQKTGLYVQSTEEEQSGSFWQLRDDTIWGHILNETLFGGSRRNKSVECTFSSSLCQVHVLRISIVAARLKNSSKQLRAAEKHSPNGAIVPNRNPAWMWCLLSRKTPARGTLANTSGTHRVVHLHK